MEIYKASKFARMMTLVNHPSALQKTVKAQVALKIWRGDDLKPVAFQPVLPGFTPSGTPGMRGLKHVGVTPVWCRKISAEKLRRKRISTEASTPSRLNLKELAREGSDSPGGQEIQEWPWEREDLCPEMSWNCKSLLWWEVRKGLGLHSKEGCLGLQLGIGFGGHVSCFVATERLFHRQQSCFAASVVALELGTAFIDRLGTVWERWESLSVWCQHVTSKGQICSELEWPCP